MTRAQGSATERLPDPEQVRTCATRLNLLVITPVGRSGSVLLQTLLDGHPAIAVFPEVAQAYDYRQTFEQAGCDIERWLTEQPGFYAGFLDAPLKDDVATYFGERRSQFVEVFEHVSSALGGASRLTSRDFMCALAMSWAVIREQSVDKLQLAVYHHHNNRGVRSDLPQIVRDFPQVKVLGTCRHPIESGLSFKTQDKRSETSSFRAFSRNVRGHSVNSWRIVSHVAGTLSDPSQLRLVDLNRLHGDPDAVLSALAGWLGVDNDPRLHRSTLCGIEWLGNSADGRPIETFDVARSQLTYHSSIGTDRGLTVDEYRFAEYFTREVRARAGYPDPAQESTVNLAGFLLVGIRNIEFFQRHVMPHDRGARKLLRRFGHTELVLALVEVVRVKVALRRDLRPYRLGVADDTE